MRIACCLVVALLLSDSSTTRSVAQDLPRVIVGDDVRTVARCGDGWLEEINGYRVVHVSGTPYEMGYQQGRLLRESVRANLNYLVNVKGNTALVKWQGVEVKPAHVIRIIQSIQKPHVPPRYLEEMDGLADGAGVPRDLVRLANFIPELFHCSGFAVMNSATKNGRLYHGRVLDYATDWRLQEHAVLVIARPQGRHAFANITYSGFTGSVTGMNAQRIAVGEMGGGGLGHWNGVPMALLIREILETADTLDEAIAVFQDNPRTCQYFYVLSDGNSNRAVGMEASWDKVQIVKPGESHELLPTAVKDCALLSAGDRYQELVRRTQAGHGKFTPQSALALMNRGVAMNSNLHNVLFEPETTNLWIANAGENKEPAATQPYYKFRLSELLTHKPAADAPQLAFSKK